jgi:predicted dehydrogenase
MVVVGQVGCGYWGPNLLRNFVAHAGCRVKWVADPSPARREYVVQTYPDVQVTLDEHSVLGDPEVDAVVVATPAATHYQIACAALAAGKHVLVEKPLAMSTAQADELVLAATAARRTLMVGHSFLYNAAVHYVKKLIEAGELGTIYYLYTQRLNLGQVRSDVNAWWNLAPHDVSILLYLRDGQVPETVSARGIDYLQRGIEDVVFATLTWPDRVAAHVHVSWLDPGKVRKVTVVGSRKMLVYDDVSDDKIAVLDKGVDRVPRAGERMDYDQADRYQLVQRAGDVWMPRIDFQEPLKLEVAHFLECIRTGSPPLTGGQHARNVVAVLEAGQRALETRADVTIAQGRT